MRKVKIAKNADWLRTQEIGGLRNGRFRVGGKMGNTKSRAYQDKYACRSKNRPED